MKKLNNMWFGFILALSIWLVISSFEYADAVRGYNATGTEVFMVALPLALVHEKMKAVERKIKSQRKLIKKYQSELMK